MIKKGIAIAGNMVVDNIKHIERYPARHALTTIRRMSRSTGGLACNCALALARLAPHIPITAISVIGDDETGDFILGEFAAHPSIDTSRVLREGVSSYTDVMTEPDGVRTFFQYRGANSLLSPAHFDFTDLDVDILHIGYILLLDGLDAEDPEYGTALCRVLAAAKRAGIRTSIDVVSEDGERFTKLVPPALAYADFCIINEFEASRTTGIPLRDDKDVLLRGNMRNACQKLIDMGVSTWAVIHSPEVSCGMDASGAYVERESFVLPQGFIRSSVGAGDVFASGILLSAMEGWGLAKALETASAAAAYSLCGDGAADAILPLDELMQRMREMTMG